MSVQMQSISTSAPFFKPQMISQGSNYFSSSSTLQRQQQSSSQTGRKQKEMSGEMEQQAGDKLSALHTRLQLEAEKIRKWKNATETEIREKNKKVQEANVAIEAQRKSVTELQLKTESLSSRLREEVANQKEIQQKISSTRNMCTALKDYAVRLDTALNTGEQDRQTLGQLHQDKMDKYKELLEMYQQLESGQRVWRDKQVKLLSEEKEMNTQLTAKRQLLEQKLNKASQEVHSLEEKNSAKEEFCQKLTKEIDEKCLALNSLQQNKAFLEESLDSKNSKVDNLKEELVLLHQQLADEHCQFNKTKDLLNNLQETFEQTKATHVEEMSIVQSDLSLCQLKIQEYTELKACLEQSLEETKCQLSNENDQLSKRLADIQQQLTLAEEEGSYLKDSLSNERKRSEALKIEKLALEKDLSKTQFNSGKLTVELKEQIQQQNERIKEVEALLVKRGSEHEASLSEWRCLEAQLQGNTAELVKEKGGLLEKVDTLEKELRVSTSQLSKVEAEFVESKKTSEKAIADLVSDKQTANNVISTLQGQTEMLSTDKDELTRQCALMEQLKAENAKLSETVQSQHSTVNTLQKELEAVQSDLSSRSGKLSSLVDQYKKEAKASKTENVEMRTTLESQIRELESKYSTTKKDLGLLVTKYKTEAENAKEEHEQTKSTFKEEIKELVSILEKYRTETQNVLATKDHEIETLQTQLNNSEIEKRSHESELAAYQDKIDLLQTDLSAKNDELKELLGAVECLQSKAKVSATPRKPKKPASEFVTPVHSTSLDTDDVVISSTPKPQSSIAAIKKLVSETPKSSSKQVKSRVSSTPHRAYSYKVTSTPLSRNNTRLMTPSVNKAKRVRSYSELEAEEMAKFKKLYPDTQLDEDEAVFKKPKITKNVAVRKASSTTAKYTLTGTKYNATRNGKQKKAERKKKPDDISWFDSDSVFGLGSIDD